MNFVHVIKIGITAALLSFVACLIAGFVAADHVDITAALRVRVVLVALSLLLTTVIAVRRWPTRRAPELTLLTGLLLGWLINPQSWIGRSYGGQLLVDAGIGSAGLDLVLWAATAAALVYLVHHRLEQ